MPRLPAPGSDDGTWGDILNEFLRVEHNDDGTQKTLGVSKGGTGATDASGARSSLGLGTAAVRDVASSGDASSSQVVKGDDTRMTNQRTPSSHASSHHPGGGDPLTSLTASSFAASSVDGTAGTASLRTLGTGAQQAMPGNTPVTGIPATIMDAKGDLIAATAADTAARLPTGTNYQNLVADSATSTGLRWKPTEYINVKDYAVGDGTTDDTTAFQAAVDAAATAGRPLYIDPGYTYLINGTVNVNHQRFRWIMPFSGVDTFTQTDAGSKILCGNLTGPCIVFGSSSQALTGIYVDGLRVWAKADRYRKPMVTFGDSTGAQAVGYLHCRDLYADGGDFYTDGFQFFSVYNSGVYSPLTVRMSGGISYDIRCGAPNVGNMAFYSGQAYHGGIGWAINQGVPGNLLNSIKLDNCKYAGAPAASKFFVSATVSGTEAIGQTVITVNDATGITTDLWATVIAANGRSWTEKVQAVSGNDVTLKGSGIPFALAAGDPLVAGNWHTITGGGLRSLLIDLAHWEDCNGLLAAGLQGADVRAPYVGNNVYRGVYVAREGQQVTLDRVTSAFGTPVPTGAALMHQANHASNQRNSVRNSNKSDWPAFADATADVLRVDGGFMASNNQRSGGTGALLGVWHQDTTVAASQTNVQLTGPQGSASRSLRVPRNGVLTGMQVSVSSARTNGTLTATLYKNGSATSLTCVIDGTNTITKTTELQNTNEYIQPGDSLDVRITTTGTWAPTSNNVDVTVWVEQ